MSDLYIYNTLLNLVWTTIDFLFLPLNKSWNTLGECKYTIEAEGAHTEWVSCVRFSPNTQNPVIVSAGWDKLVKVRFFLFNPTIFPTMMN